MSGPITRKRKSQKKYDDYRRDGSGKCDFCIFEAGKHPVVKAFDNFWIVQNLFGYDFWDGTSVSEHLMLVPKRHIESLDELSDSEAKEHMKIVASSESRGYSIYSRAPQNTSRTVPHQHTHLIKTNDKKQRVMFFMHKPHIVLHF